MSTDRPALAVSEVYGPTVSGEGPTLGERCAVLRLMGCNLDCTFCDSAFTWDASRYNLRNETRVMPWGEIAERLMEIGAPFVIVTGGEPLLHQTQRAWVLLMLALKGAGIRVEAETNGTVTPTLFSSEHIGRFVVSPKLTHSGVVDEKRIVPSALQALLTTQKAIFKFVCASAEDVGEVTEIVRVFGIPADQVWIMPEGATGSAVSLHLKAVADAAVAAGYNLTTRLHIHAWEDQRER